MNIPDPKTYWQGIAKRDDWRDFILPRDSDDDFYWEGWLESQRLLYFFDDKSVVVDYGCGIGRVINYVAERAAYVIGLDISSEFLIKGDKQVIADNVEFFDANEYKSNNVADLIYSLRVLQHNDSKNRSMIINHIVNILKPGGTAIMTFPRFESSYYVEDAFTHKFKRDEIDEYGQKFKSYKILTGCLPGYQNGYDRKDNHEYFLMGDK